MTMDSKMTSGLGMSEDYSEPAKAGKRKGKKSLAQIKRDATQKIMGKKQVKPKRPMSAYFHFSNENRLKVKEANPQFRIGDVAKANSVAWKALTAE